MAEDLAQSSDGLDVKIILVLILVILVVLLAPFAYRFDVGPGPDSIEAVIWHYIESPWFTGFRFQDPFRYFPYIFVRLLFSLQFLRYLQGKSSRKVTLLVAAYSELHVALLSLPVYISWYFSLGVFSAPDGDPFLPIFLPIPLLFLVSLFLILIVRGRM
jgi:hypothetical protein